MFYLPVKRSDYDGQGHKINIYEGRAVEIALDKTKTAGCRKYKHYTWVIL